MAQAPSLSQVRSLLLKFGDVGAATWNVGQKKFKNDDDLRIWATKELARLAKAVKLSKKYRHGIPPVSFRVFVESPEYLNQPNTLYPKVLEEGEELNSGKYIEAVLTGGIGTGKSTLAIFTTIYQVYVVSCLKNPHAEFGLSSADEIVFIIQSITGKHAVEVDFARMQKLIQQAPYFRKRFPPERDMKEQIEFPNRIFIKPISGATTGAIGQNVIGGIMDEMNFMSVVEGSKLSKDGGTFDQAWELYRAIRERRSSRFMRQGDLPGMLCLVSSKQYPGEFTDVKIEEARRDVKAQGFSRIFVYDKRVWDVKPEGTYTGKKFRVFLGDEARKPRVMSEEEAAPVQDKHLVIDVPLELKGPFDSDILSAIRDIAGHSTYALHPYIIDPDKVSKCFGRAPSIFALDACDFVTTIPTTHPTKFKNLHWPRWVHLDLSETSDSTGVACGYIRKFMEIERTPNQIEVLPEIVYDFILEVRPPKNGEILFHKIRALLMQLRQLGLPIQWVTMDSYQSTDMKQMLAAQGFSTGIKSVDTDTLPYDFLKQALYDHRVRAPVHKRAEIEIIRLERDPKSHKIDHPPKGSKDCSDAMAGVAYGLMSRRELWVQHNVPLTHFPEVLATKGM